MIVADDLARVAGEALREVVGGEVGIGDGRDRHRDPVSVCVQRAAGYVAILGPLLLQIRQGLDENDGDVYVDLAVGFAAVRSVNRRRLLLTTDWRIESCHCCQAQTG